MNKTVKTNHQTKLQDALYDARSLMHDPELTYNAFWFNELESALSGLVLAVEASLEENNNDN